MLNRFLRSAACLMCLLFALPALAWSPDRYYLQLYYGQFSDMALRQVFTQPGRIDDFKDANMLTLGVGAENWYWKERVGLGAEFNSSFHWDYGDQEFPEFSAALFIRFRGFPWRDYVPTAMAIGDGLSYTPVYPRYECDYGASKGEPLESHLLNFFFLEVSFGLSHGLELMVRLHHRCTAWGLFAPQSNAGSNFPSIGLRYTF
jgi:hypothetical protein